MSVDLQVGLHLADAIKEPLYMKNRDYKKERLSIVGTGILTSRQRLVLDFYKDYKRKYRILPTMRVVAKAFGYKVHTSVQRHTEALQKKGLLVVRKVGRPKVKSLA